MTPAANLADRESRHAEIQGDLQTASASSIAFSRFESDANARRNGIECQASFARAIESRALSTPAVSAPPIERHVSRLCLDAL